MKESSRHLASLLGPAEGIGPAYLRVAGGLRALIDDGRLTTGTRLPSERQLAATLGVSRTTVTAAYDALRAEGYADSRQGSGTLTRRPAGRTTIGERSPVWAPPLVNGRDSDVVDLTQAAIPANLPAVESAYRSALDELPTYLPGHGYAVPGLDVLRDAVAEWFARRGLPTGPEQIMITSGAQQAISIIADRLVSPGDRVIIDHPTYPGAIDGFQRFGARLAPVPLGADERDLQAYESTVAQTAPRLAYVIVDFHNPTGLLADDTEREALADILARARVTTIIDETLVDVVLDDDVVPPTPMAAMAPSTITIGSASKSYWGGLRIGWIRAEPRMIERLVAGRSAVDYASPVLEQLAVTHLLSDSAAPADLRSMLRPRRTALVEAVGAHLPTWRVAVPRGGLSLWFDLGARVSTRLVHAAADRGVLLAVGPRFGIDGAFENRLRIPYCAPEDHIRDGVARIADLWSGLDRSAHIPATRGALV